jgi:hypothetical protein
MALSWSSEAAEASVYGPELRGSWFRETRGGPAPPDKTDTTIGPAMRHRPSTDSAVLACVSGRAGLARAGLARAGREPTIDDRDLPDVLTRARHHQVTAYVHRELLKTGAARSAQAVTAWLQGSEITIAMQQLRSTADLQSVYRIFTAAGVDWFLIKGPVFAERVYPAPSLRPSRDLDVVVRAKDFAAAIDALEANGALLLDANWDMAVRSRLGQLHIRLPHGTTMDLHWHLINSGHVRDVLNISMPSVWQDLRTVIIHDQQASTLSVTDTVVHLGLHAALGGACRLRWLNDLKLVIDHEAVDWGSVLARCCEWRASRLLGVTLARSARLLGSDVPDDVLTELMGSRLYRSTTEMLDRMSSPMTATRSWAPARLWPQFVRESWQDTLRAVGWRVRRRAANGLRGFWHERERPEMMTPSGGHHGRERYLRLVEGGQFDRTGSASAVTTVRG